MDNCINIRDCGTKSTRNQQIAQAGFNSGTDPCTSPVSQENAYFVSCIE
jgi:hypothetical protein